MHGQVRATHCVWRCYLGLSDQSCLTALSGDH
jgi:hypothetical protein